MRIFLTAIVASLSSALFAQGWMSQSARSSALANNGVTFIDAFAYHHNPGALGYIEKGTVGLSYENRYALKELQSQGVALAVPLKVGTISAGGQFYGYDAYRTMRIGVGYSMKLIERLSAGVQINYLGMRLGDYYGSKHGISAEFGALAILTKDIHLGFSVVNLGRARLSNFQNERYGTLLRLGASYQIIPQLLLVGEFEQEIHYRFRARLGIEYAPIDLLYIRAGVQGAPLDLAFGLGLKIKWFRLDVSTQYNMQLGWSPATSFIVDFYTPKKKN